MILKARDGTLRRLSWEADPGGADRRRAVPAGEHRILGVRVVRAGKGGSTWHLSATGNTLGRVTATAGETTRIEYDETVRVRGRLAAEGPAMEVHGPGRAGLSVYRDGRRIGVEYALLAPDGTERARGAMTYG